MGRQKRRPAPKKREERMPSTFWSATKGGPGLASPVPSTATHTGRARWAEKLSHRQRFTNRRAEEVRGKSTFQSCLSAELRIAASGAHLRDARLFFLDSVALRDGSARLNGTDCRALQLADDLAIIAQSAEDQQRLLDAWERYCDMLHIETQT